MNLCKFKNICFCQSFIPLSSRGKHIKQLEEQIADMNDAYKVVMDEKCADDEIHCTCVPALRQQIKELELGIQKISTEVFKIWEYYKRQNDPNADSYLRIYDDLKALEGK